MIGFSRFISRRLAALTAVGLLMAAGSGSAAAQDRRQNAPGEFDFYVLSLSWSPSFCEAANERGNTGKSTRIQCGGRPYSFVVHGLWPQYERGFPNYCQRPAPRLDRRVMSSMLDLMPAPGLIYNEWDKHGTCSGLGARAYFETTRKARAAVKIPADYLELNATKTVAPAEIEDAFIKASYLFNATLQVDFTDHLRGSLTVRNLLDKDPVKDPTWSGYPYYNASWFDTIGRSFFMQITYKLGGKGL